MVNPFFVDRYDIGHFTCLANDQQTHIGCAGITFEYSYLACNYSYTNIPAYVAPKKISNMTVNNLKNLFFSYFII